MATKNKTKIRYVDVNVNKGNFVSKLIGADKSHDFSDIKLLRNLLSNEKARILYILKSKIQHQFTLSPNFSDEISNQSEKTYQSSKDSAS